jgi:Zn-dependent M28 family amino/carboxypeptidase
VRELEQSGIAALPPGERRRHEFDLPGNKPASRSSNLLGFLAGSDPSRSNEIVVLGAHYDHVGVREGVIYPGAEDNASGAAVVLQVARALARRRQELGRSVLVVFFGAEELGMVGSRALLRDGLVERERMVAMVNVDMIGRPLADRTGFGLPLRALGIDAARSVAALGTKDRPALRDIVRQSCLDAGIELVVPEELPPPLGAIVEAVARGRADSATFEDAGIPALFFSAGESGDYHQPTDTAERLEPLLLAHRAEAIFRTVLRLSQSPALAVR